MQAIFIRFAGKFAAKLHNLGRISFCRKASQYSFWLVRISNLVNQSLASRERQLKIELPPLDILLAGYKRQTGFLAQGLAKNFQDHRSVKVKNCFYEICGFKNKVQFQDRSKELQHLLEKIKVQKEGFFCSTKNSGTLSIKSPEAKIAEDKKKPDNMFLSCLRGFTERLFSRDKRLFCSLQSLRKQRPVFEE